MSHLFKTRNLILFGVAGRQGSAIKAIHGQNRDRARYFTARQESNLNFVLAWLDRRPRQVLAATGAVCLLLLGFGLYLQQVVGLVPCPMCIVQRYVLVLIALLAGLAAFSSRRGVHIGFAALLTLLGLLGAFVAARQSWLQWYPPEFASCGRDLYGMIETFPLQRVIPMLFKGGGDCTKVDWTFLGGSIANWSFLWFCAIVLLASALVWCQSARLKR
jgi:disulfide bond formation protein DsbB